MRHENVVFIGSVCDKEVNQEGFVDEDTGSVFEVRVLFVSGVDSVSVDLDLKLLAFDFKICTSMEHLKNI